MKKVLVTGSGGFIGSHLVERLVATGASVRAFVHYNSTGRRGWLEQSKVLGELEVVAGDIRDFDAVSAAVQGCQEVYHLAALIGIPYSYVSPLAYVQTNIVGTYNVLESARRFGVEQVLVTSTSETYGTAQAVPIREDHPAVGQSPYAATKVGADQLALSYHRSFALPVKIVRPFNTFGSRQSARAVIPTIIGQLLSGRKKLQLGNLRPTRDLTFVLDTVEGFLAIAGCPKLIGTATNIGNNQEVSIGDLARLLVRLCGVEVEIEGENEARLRPDASEVMRLCCDNSRLVQHTGWRPRHSLEDGLRLTIEWMRDHLKDYRVDDYMR